MTYLGYTGVSAQWMTIPTNLFQALCAIVISNISDRLRDRSGPLTIGLLCKLPFSFDVLCLRCLRITFEFQIGASVAFIVMATVWGYPGLIYGLFYLNAVNGAQVALLHGWVSFHILHSILEIGLC